MSNQNQRGFTLIEVVLAVAVGLIIVAGVSVGYTYAKRSSIIANQRKNVASIKTFVEQAIASNQANIASGTAAGATLAPPAITNAQLTALATRLPSLFADPYTGTARSTCTPTGTAPATSCYGSASGVATVSAAASGTGSGVAYYYMSSFASTITVNVSDGTTRSCNGYAVVETDNNGQIVAAECGTANQS